MSPAPVPPPTDADSAHPHVAASLGRIPSGLFVITWRAGEADRVMLASWVMQAGFEPPLVSLAIGTSRDLLAAVRGGASFVVNVLAESQRSLLARFGKPIADGDDPFAGLAVERTTGGVATLTDAPAWLACHMVGETSVAGADHVVVLARVDAARGTPDTPPLVHLRRNGFKY